MSPPKSPRTNCSRTSIRKAARRPTTGRKRRPCAGLARGGSRPATGPLWPGERFPARPTGSALVGSGCLRAPAPSGPIPSKTLTRAFAVVQRSPAASAVAWVAAQRSAQTALTVLKRRVQERLETRQRGQPGCLQGADAGPESGPGRLWSHGRFGEPASRTGNRSKRHNLRRGFTGPCEGEPRLGRVKNALASARDSWGNGRR